MLGTHHLYVLIRKDRLALKVGNSSSLTQRVRTLNRKYGPLCSSNSISLRTDDKREAALFETTLKNLLSDYRIPLPVKRRGNGETEWFMGQCYEELIDVLRELALARHGNGYHIGAIDVDNIAPLTTDSMEELAKFGKKLKKLLPRIEIRHLNVSNIRAFRFAVGRIIPNLIGVAKILSENNERCYEIFLRPTSCTRQELKEIFDTGRLSAEDDGIWAGSNLCTSIEANGDFQRAIINFGSMHEVFDQSWTSKDCVTKLASLIEDLSIQYPLPPAYKEFVGRSFLDNMSEEERQNIGLALWQALFHNKKS